MSLSKDQFNQMVKVQKFGTCNMYDRFCISKYVDFDVTRELHVDYMENYKKHLANKNKEGK